MASILKIVSTPVKWASKKIINKTLLGLPSGGAHDPILCTFCPEMCRFSCPTAVVSGNDSVTPRYKNSLLYKKKKWPKEIERLGVLWPLYDCTGCGRCTEYCVYGMPVGDMLVRARAENPWDQALEASKKLTPKEDPVGDLAYELGDVTRARATLERYMEQFTPPARPIASEPKSVFFMRSMGQPCELYWSRSFFSPSEEVIRRTVSRLLGPRWIVHESVWLSRRMKHYDDAIKWVDRLRAHGVQLTLPFESGRDCIDCGGEGAYRLMFPEQALQMAREVWNRDRNRADGILCFSDRCKHHLRKALGEEIPVLSLPSVIRKL